jgi:manganese/zinc/iron transport system permease protein
MMSWIQGEIILVAMITAAACALPGIFLVLRGAALMSDALSHSMLPGIVILFFVTGSLHSPLLLVGACLSGLLTVLIIETIIKTECIKKDAAIGVSFPLFFSIGVILITLYARNIHLDTDMVLLGELAFVPFNRLMLGGLDCGPLALYLMSIALLCNICFVALAYKELALSIFDPHYAMVTGFSPRLLYYILMILVSFTIVGAFDVVGAIVVVSLMVVPASAASLLTQKLHHLIFLTLILTFSATLIGYTVAHACDLSLAGSIAVAQGAVFAGCFFVSIIKSSV